MRGIRIGNDECLREGGVSDLGLDVEQTRHKEKPLRLIDDIVCRANVSLRNRKVGSRGRRKRRERATHRLLVICVLWPLRSDRNEYPPLGYCR